MSGWASAANCSESASRGAATVQLQSYRRRLKLNRSQAAVRFSGQRGILQPTNRFVGLDVPVENVSVTVQAQGNTWFTDTQGADAQGHYPTMQLMGPASGENFNLGNFITLSL
jgi:hypothetical protein